MIRGLRLARTHPMDSRLKLLTIETPWCNTRRCPIENTQRQSRFGMTVWVRNNPRPLSAALAAVCFAALLIAWAFWQFWDIVWLRGGLAVVLGLMLAYAGWLLWQLSRPRIGADESQLYLFLTAGRAIAVPLEHVECFLLGQAAAMMDDSKRETTTLSLRIAEKAGEFQQRNVLRALGSWCGGYVTVRGTWTQPLSVDLVRKLNRELAQAKEQLAANQA